MESASTGSVAKARTPGGPSRRSWRGRAWGAWFCIVWLILVIATTGLIAVGGRSDPRGGQVLDGPWRFHAGDNPAWASPDADDRSWDHLTLVANPDRRDGDVGIPGYFDGWRAHGHPALDGYGWYRRQVALPAHGDLVLVGPPAVDDGYEMFWDGRPVGGIGRLSSAPKVNTTRPFRVVLPPADGRRTAVLAIRAFMQPGPGRDGQSGGLRTAPVLASRADGEALYRAEWLRTIAGYIVDAVESLAMLVLAAVAAVFGYRKPFLRWLALGLVASACLRLGNAVSAWTDLIGGPALSWQNSVILAPLAKLAWTLAWNAWTDGRDRRPIMFVAVAAWLALVSGALAGVPMLETAGRAAIGLALAAIAVRILRHGEHRALVVPAMALTAVGLFAADLSAFGVPGIWFPFNIGVSRSQFAYVLALPLLGFVVAFALRDDSGRQAWSRSHS